MGNEVDEARRVLRWATDRSSIRAVAEEVGVEQSVLNRFVNSEGRKPRPDVLQRLLPYVARRRAEYARSTGPSGASALPGKTAGPSDLVQVPATTLAYWRGRFDAMAEWSHAIDAMMRETRDQFARYTDGVTAFRDSGVLGAGQATPTPIHPDELLPPGGDAAGGKESA